MSAQPALSVAVECHGDRVTIIADVDGTRAQADAKAPLGAAVTDILTQLHTRGMPAGAYRTAGKHLGGLLFSGAAGDAIRDALRADPERTIALTLDARVADWPWELLLDPESGKSPVLQGAEIVRIGGDPVPRRGIAAVGILAVPESQGHARLEALQAATRHLGRKTDIEFRAANPASGPHLRELLAHGASLVHLTSVDEDGGVELDDGRVPIERIGIGGDTWLTILEGRGVTTAAARRLRRSGSALVMALQIELRPNERAAVDREFYRALASGAPLLGAVRRARRALVRSAGEDSCAWAAPILWCAPSDGVEVFAQPFPPPARMDSAIATAPSRRAPVAAAQSPYPDLDGPLGVPVPAAIFVHDTMHAARLGGDPARLSSRVEALHALAGDAEVPTDATGQELIDRLLDLIGRPNNALAAPADIDEASAAIAGRTGIDTQPAAQVLRSLLTGRAVWITDDDPAAARRLARYAAEGLGYHPVFPAHGESVVCGATPGGPNGALYRAIATNWRRDELDPAHASHPDPTHRVPVMVRSRDQWRCRQGTWLVVTQAHRLPSEQIDAALAALDEGELWFTDVAGRPQRIAVPQDFRIMFVGAPPFAPLGSAIGVVSPISASDPEVEMRRWLTYAQKTVGPVADANESQAREEVAVGIRAVLEIARLSGPVPTDIGSLALSHTLLADLDEALLVHLGPLLDARTPAARGLLAAWLTHGPKGVKSTTWQEADGADALQDALDTANLPASPGPCPGLVARLLTSPY